MPQLRSGRNAEFNISLEDKENMPIKKSSKIKKSSINKWEITDIDDKDASHKKEELVVSFGNLFETSSNLLDEESVKLIDNSLNGTFLKSKIIEVNSIDSVHNKKSLSESVNYLNDSERSQNEMKEQHKSQQKITDSIIFSEKLHKEKKVNLRRSTRIKNKVSFVNGHTEIKSPSFENEQLNASNYSTPKKYSVDKNSPEKNNLTYSNEKVIDLTYSGEKTSTDILQMLRTPTTKKGTPYVKRLQRKSSSNTSTPLNFLTKLKSQKSIIEASLNSPVFNISKTSINKVKITLPPSSLSKSNVFIFGSPKPSSRTPFTPKTENPIKTPGKSCTKMPNFASAHKKIFEKMESIEEYKQRKAERAEALMNRDKVISRVKPSQNVYNQFGFRLHHNRPKLEQAKTLVMNKLAPEVNKSKIQQYVKGVRSNRRFDLLMKSRQNNLQSK